MRTRRPRPNRRGCLDLSHRSTHLPCPYCTDDQADIVNTARRLHARLDAEDRF
ncbi:hypothetical protein Daura_50180 [Dactylosporangium aurantiacum]|uniref:Uncharacterized protein n=1 Tax=Dactylosporangium aurantiacum TaxID=35754 RepID=A0A9Q9IGY7_9ACTN|nr:hypothetical protein [Dactylosporangium aurantiacum]MDG6107355.1 hypothetical protein [Dactylosporangium aurantiacum]UWZ54513.1 hypothetical protein Daura_50180 [Dactylosporangium aurantiacum]